MNAEIAKIAALAERNETSFFQITYFLIGQEPTAQAKLHKCIHEIHGRVKSIQSLEMEQAELTDLIELQTLEMNKLDNSPEGVIKKRMMNRKIHSGVEQVRRLEDKRQSWEQEISYLYQIFSAISERTPLKKWGSFDVQLEYWSEKLKHEIKTRALLNTPIDLETVKAVLSLPDNAPVKQEVLQLVSGSAPKAINNEN